MLNSSRLSSLIHIFNAQLYRPSSPSRIGPVAHRLRVVDFSIGIMGIFASAVIKCRIPSGRGLTGSANSIFVQMENREPVRNGYSDHVR
jgi:hypothetical protein